VPDRSAEEAAYEEAGLGGMVALGMVFKTVGVAQEQK
jgi:hypothetical protein